MCKQADKNMIPEIHKMISAVYRNFSTTASRHNDYSIFTISHGNKNGITAKKTAEYSRTRADAIYDDINLDNLVDESGKLAHSGSGVEEAIDAVISDMSYQLNPSVQ